MSKYALEPAGRRPAEEECGERTEAFYHPELDALRFFAFLAVFLHHGLPREISLYVNSGIPAYAAGWLMSAKEAGAFGVDLFFTLSSYLITELLVREHLSRGRIDVPAFYARRALRIWPLYFTFLAAAVLLVPRVMPDERLGWGYAAAFALFGGNWACALWGIPFSVAGPLWSVSVEEQFYLTWPLLILCFGVRRIGRLALALLAVACVTRVVLAAAGAGQAAVWCNTLARLDPIALGALLAVGLRGRAPALGAAARIALGCGGLLLWVLAARYLGQAGATSLVLYPAVAAGGLMLLVASLRDDAPRLRRAPLSCLVYLGRISYGLYVFHLFALTLMARLLSIPVLGLSLNFERRLACAFVLTVLLAAASYALLERPFLRLKRRFTHVLSGGAGEPPRPARGEAGAVTVTREGAPALSS